MSKKVAQDFKEDFDKIIYLTKHAIGSKKQSEFSRESGINNSYLNKLLKGKLPNVPTPKTLLRIADFSELDENNLHCVSEEEILIAGGYEPSKYIREIQLPDIEPNDRTIKSEVIELLSRYSSDVQVLKNISLDNTEDYQLIVELPIDDYLINNWIFITIDEWDINQVMTQVRPWVEHKLQTLLPKALNGKLKISFVTEDRMIYDEICKLEFNGITTCISTIWMGTYRYNFVPYFETYLNTGFTKFVCSEDDLDHLFNKITFKPDYIKKANCFEIEKYNIYAHPDLQAYNFNIIEECNQVKTFIYADNGFGDAKGIIVFSKDEPNKDNLKDILEMKNSSLEEYVKEASTPPVYQVGVTFTDFQMNNFTIAFKRP